MTARRIGRELASLQGRFGAGVARKRRALLEALGTADGPRNAADLVRLHEALLFARAYPDSAAVLEGAEKALRRVAGWARDLVRRRPEAASDLEGTGIAGTEVRASFSLPVVGWLRERFPDAVTTSLGGAQARERVAEALPAALLPVEREAIADGYLRPDEWLRLASMSGSDRRRSPTVPRRLFDLLDEPGRSAVWGALGLETRWDLGGGGGSRTLARAPDAPRSFQGDRFDRSAPDLRAELRRGALSPRRVAPREARAWKDLALAAVTCRYREMHTFAHASPDDVLVADAGHGLRFAFLGVLPEQRHPLRTFYGFLMEKNGVPIGYGDAILLFEWGEINFHVFETFRRAESARTFATLLRAFCRPFGLRYLFLNRYQFGRRNEEAIETGAFWFYEKLGFRPMDASLEAIRAAERRRRERDPSHRTPSATLRRLARGHMELLVGEGAEDSVRRRYRGFHPLNVALAVSRAVADRYAGDREAARTDSARRVRRVLGGSWSGPEAAALEALSPALGMVSDLGSWTRSELDLLARIVRAKAGRSERDALTLTRRHSRLRRAILALGR